MCLCKVAVTAHGFELHCVRLQPRLMHRTVAQWRSQLYRCPWAINHNGRHWQPALSSKNCCHVLNFNSFGLTATFFFVWNKSNHFAAARVLVCEAAALVPAPRCACCTVTATCVLMFRHWIKHRAIVACCNLRFLCREAGVRSCFGEEKSRERREQIVCAMWCVL